MLNISRISNKDLYLNSGKSKTVNVPDCASNDINNNYKKYTAENIKAYIPSFTAKTEKPSNSSGAEFPDKKMMIKTVASQLEKADLKTLQNLDKKGLLDNNDSNDGTSVLQNLYKIATEPRIQGLNTSRILSEVMTAIDNPYTITQKFGDIPDEVAAQIEQETGKEFPQQAKNVVSSCCVVASIEFNMASRTPAEFARFAQGLSGENYSVSKNIKMKDIAEGTVSGIWMLREFGAESVISDNWEDITLKIKPDRNAIVRARIQNSYRDAGERSCTDVLMQSALLNLGSQHTYDALTDERTGKFNSDNTGLTDFEKNFVEQVVFGTPKISVVYQTLDENGYLTAYNCKSEEIKQHILKSLQLGQNVIIGYVHMDENKKVDGGHEITITGYEQGSDGKGYFVCNDTDDDIDAPVKIPEEKLLGLIHHAGISKEALNKDDVVVESWREILDEFKKSE